MVNWNWRYVTADPEDILMDLSPFLAQKVSRNSTGNFWYWKKLQIQ